MAWRVTADTSQPNAAVSGESVRALASLRTCFYGWPEGCEFHMPDEAVKWCPVCLLLSLLREVRLDEWVQEQRPEWCWRVDRVMTHIDGPTSSGEG